jgi:hypothetical protein
VAALLRGLKGVGRRVGRPAARSKEDDRRKVVWDAVGYVTNNRDKIDYPRYRKLGLPISSASVESTIKRGGEAVLQVRAAYLSEDGRAERYWAEPRPRGRAVGAGRLGRKPS